MSWECYLDIVPLDFIAEPIVGGECDGQQSYSYDG